MSFSDRKIVVLGLGRFGGGVGVTRWLAEQGARVLVTDRADEASLQQSLAQLEDLQEIRYRLSEHLESDLDGADLVVVNPAVDQAKSPFVQAAVARGIPLTSEMNLFWQRCCARIIGVTGSAGKSTTTAMIFDVLHAHLEELAGSPKNVWLGGNIGVSLLDVLAEMDPQDWVVLELSSFQLAGLAGVSRGPHISVLTSLFPQHLDRHGDWDSYLDAKVRIFEHQTAADFAVVNRSALDTLIESGRVPSGPTVIPVTAAEELQGLLKVRGAHHLENAAAALAVGRLAGLDDAAIIQELSQFQGLPHRLEWVREYNQVQYYNDSKSTSPQATMTALQSFDGGIVLLVGGYDKPGDYDRLAEEICRRCRVVLCFGAARAKIATLIRRQSPRLKLPNLKSVHEFNGGVHLARRLARPGEVVLFSPGYPSYDDFDNYQQRGEHFKALVNSWV